MSGTIPEDTGMGESIPDPSLDETDDDSEQLARYSIHVPLKDNNGRDIPHVLGAARQALSAAGLKGRTVFPLVQGDWEGDDKSYQTEDMAIIVVDAPDNPETLQAIKTTAQGVKEAADQEAVYITKQDISTYLV